MIKSPKEEEKVARGIQSVEIGLALLYVLAKHRTPQMLKSLAAEAEMPPSKAHRYLASFIRAGLVRQVGNQYLLGLGALQLGLSAMGAMDVVGLALNRLQNIRDDVGETVGLVVWAQHGPTYVRVIESDRTVSVNSRAGSVLPLLDSASGHLFLAYLPESQTRELVKSELAAISAHPEKGADKHRDVDNIRTQTRRHGLGRVDGHYFPGIAALSAPIFNYADELAATITVLGPQDVLDIHPEGELARKLKSHVQIISKELGYGI